MPKLVENIKSYFKTLQINASENNFHDTNLKEQIRDIEISGLFTDISVDKAIGFINREFSSMKSLSKDILNRTLKQQLRSLELMIVVYQLHGFFAEELNAIKFYRNLLKIQLDIDERNYAYALEALWHLVHDSKCCVPLKSVELCREIVVNRNNKEVNRKSIIVSLAKLIFESTDPDVPVLIKKIKDIKSQNRSFFDKPTIDAFLTRSFLTYYEYVLKSKAFTMGIFTENYNLVECGFIMRKVAMKSIEFLGKKYVDSQMHSGSYEMLHYLWIFVNHLLIGMQYITEYFTLLGVDREAKQYQNELFCYSVRYCVPFRTKIAVRLMMHTDFIYLRLPELSIRTAQLNHIRTGSSKSLSSLLQPQSMLQCTTPLDPAVAEYNYPISATEHLEYLNTPIHQQSKSKKNRKPNVIHLDSNGDSGKEITFEECFLTKSTFKSDFLDILSVIKSYIWKIESTDTRFSFSDEWEINFIEPQDEDDSLAQELLGLDLSTPTNTPTKSSNSPERSILAGIVNAPARIKRNEINKPMIIKKSNWTENEENDDDFSPIESFQTVFLPNKTRNIKYEELELPRSTLGYQSQLSGIISMFNKYSCALPVINRHDLKRESVAAVVKKPTPPLDTSIMSGKISLIKYLEDHCDKFKYFNVPVIHRPIFQRLGLHYLSVDPRKASFYFSLAISIGFRQLYLSECNLKNYSQKSLDAIRWQNTYETVNKSLISEQEMHSALKSNLPIGWTVLQFTLIDEIPISSIRSSLLDGNDGGCLGARNCAVLLVTKYQKLRGAKIDKEVSQLTVETRVMHGFRKTGLQLMAQLENLKSEATKSLKISDRKNWWSKRFSIDTGLKSLTDQMRMDWFSEDNQKWMMDEGSPLEQEPKILILDRNICQLPVECLLIGSNRTESPKCITRMPNMAVLIGHLYQSRYRHVSRPESMINRMNLEVDPQKTYFVVNPDNTLQETEDAVLPLFKKKLNWDGFTGKSGNSLDALNILSSKDMLIYCGHGSGGRYFMDKSLKSITSSASIFLIGCQSARFITEGRSESYGVIMYYLLIGCPAVFGLLWDVTDREIDKLTVNMLSNWLGKADIKGAADSEHYTPVAPMPSYVFDNDVKDHIQLKSLTGDSPVICGLPVWIDDKIDLSKWKL